MIPAKLPCLCVDVVEHIFQHVPLMLHLLAIAMGFLAVGAGLGALLVTLLECSFTRQIADFIRGEKRKRKNDEL